MIKATSPAVQVSLFASIFTCASAFAAATTLTFDDLTPGNFGVGTIPADYDGLSLACDTALCTLLDSATYGGNPSGYLTAPASGLNVLSSGYNGVNSASILSIRRADGGLFALNSWYVTSAWRDGMQLTVTALNGLNTVGSTTIDLGAAGTRLYETFNWGSVTEIKVTHAGGTADPRFTFSSDPIYAIDNLTYTPTVPEPTGALAMLVGVGVIAGSAARRSAQKTASKCACRPERRPA